MSSLDKELETELQSSCRIADIKDSEKKVSQKEARDSETGITEADLDANFSKIAKGRNHLNLSELVQVVIELAREKNIDLKMFLGNLLSPRPILAKAVDPLKEAIGKPIGITEEDFDAAFLKIARGKNHINLSELVQVVIELAREKNIEIEVLLGKLAYASPHPSHRQILAKSYDPRKKFLWPAYGITEADVSAAFSKVAKDEKGLDVVEVIECVHELARRKDIKPHALLQKLIEEPPSKLKAKAHKQKIMFQMKRIP